VVDGSVSSCAVTGLGTVNNDTAASVTLSVARGTHAPKQGPLVLDVENSAWKISATGPEQQGTDLGGLQTAARFCADLASANYHDIYAMMTDNAKGGNTEAFAAAFFSGSSTGIKWNSCAVDATKFKLTATSATTPATSKITDLSTGVSVQLVIDLTFIKAGNGWQLDDVVVEK
jgi:hypothetical protein